MDAGRGQWNNTSEKCLDEQQPDNRLAEVTVTEFKWDHTIKYDTLWIQSTFKCRDLNSRHSFVKTAKSTWPRLYAVIIRVIDVSNGQWVILIAGSPFLWLYSYLLRMIFVTENDLDLSTECSRSVCFFRSELQQMLRRNYLSYLRATSKTICQSQATD